MQIIKILTEKSFSGTCKFFIMKKRFVFIFFAIITSNYLFAQNSTEIKGTGRGLFLEHIVARGENLYSIGRMYNVQAKEVASYNHLQFESALIVAQNLKIPLDKNNFIQTAASTESFVPIYHTVARGEGLYRVSLNYNKVPLDLLKKWNHLQSYAVNAGVPLIVGYLKVDKNQSSLRQTAQPETNLTITPTSKEEKPVEKKSGIVAETTPVVKEPSPAQTEEPKITVTAVNTKSKIDFSGGYFKKLYEQQTEKKSPLYARGTVGIFKSNSGWQDGKYYCFNNDAAPGTVLKIADNATGKIVYAKVLDAIPDIKQNSGLAVVLSNAAAEELGTGDDKFDCVVSYVK